MRPRFGGLVGLAVGSIAWMAGNRTFAIVVGTIGLSLFVASFVAPVAALRAFQRALEKLGELVGRLVGALVLTPVFVLFFVPFGLLAKRGARDPLRRRFERNVPSYWKKREKPSNAERPF